MSSFNHSIRNFITKLVVSGVAFLIFLCIPKLLGPELFGIFSFQTAFVGLLIPLNSFGFGSGIVYLLSSNKYVVTEVSNTILRLAFVIAIINGALVSILYNLGFLQSFVASINANQMVYFSLAIFCQSLSFILGRLFYGNSDFKILNRIEISISLLNPILLIALFFLLGSADATFLYISFLGASLIGFLLHAYFARRFWNRKEYNKEFVKAASSYGMQSWPGDLAVRANLRMDQLILISFSSASALGVYNIAVKLVELVWLIPDAIGPVLFNRIAKQEQSEESLALIARLHRLLLSFSLALLIFLALITYYIIIPFFLGTDYSAMMIPLVLLIPGSLFLISSKIFTKLFSATGQVKWTSQISIIGALVSLVGYFLLIPMWGMQGAAIASTIGYFCLSAAGWILLVKNYPIHLLDFFDIRLDDWIWLFSNLKQWYRSNLTIQINADERI
ncbi:MAG: polysaccharide biosynthesis C-terminal domain-containing protein [Saprospiraceae bacterium]|nr:polysaccharide biosynthesis C-terminal domain-containing protein [Saprospiraceae bacterium]MBK8296652.1 polysaccharide biosynthesis C-terminal domain-containing protein [Saprospiraceae bacterium]